MTLFQHLLRVGYCIAAAAVLVAPTCDGQHTTVGREKIGRHEKFLLPSKYEGPFIALYDQQDGLAAHWVGDTAVYAVPGSGIVKIKSAEPEHSSTTSFVFQDRRGTSIPNFTSCADMRSRSRTFEPRICWFDYWVGGTGVPDHIVAVVTNWTNIPPNFERTSIVYDSLLHKGTGKTIRKWAEPKVTGQKRTAAKPVN